MILLEVKHLIFSEEHLKINPQSNKLLRIMTFVQIEEKQKKNHVQKRKRCNKIVRSLVETKQQLTIELDFAFAQKLKKKKQNPKTYQDQFTLKLNLQEK